MVDFVSEDYGEIAEILNRHKTLKSANEDLKARQKDTGTENEEKRAEFSLNVKVCLSHSCTHMQHAWTNFLAVACRREQI